MRLKSRLTVKLERIAIRNLRITKLESIENL